MDYRVMKRPMFKMGGPTSGGTGITSGLETPRQNYQGAGLVDFANLGTSSEMEKILMNKMINRDQNYDSMMSLPKLQAIGSIASNVLPNVERGGLKGIVDILKDPATINAAIQGLSQTKKLELQRDDQKLKDMAAIISMKTEREKIDTDKDNKDRMFEIEGKKYDLNVREFESKQEYQKELIRIKEAELAKKSESNTIKNYNKAKLMLDETNMSEEQKADILLGVLTGGAYQSVQKQAANLRRILIADPDMSESKKNKILSDFKELNLSIFSARTNEAEGGRINKQMGGGFDMGQAPQETNLAPMAPQETNLAPQGQDPFTILRSRLPQEISDEVVSLIAYNKKAFADFANIQDQDDVDLFNQKYNVQLVVDLASR